MKDIKVRKSNGDLVRFDPDKLMQALINSGASFREAEDVAQAVVKRIEDGMKTSKIYRLAYDILRRRSKYVAGRYRLKKAVFDLGPSGYPFEKFVSKLLENQGYKVDINVIGQGRCVTHELDVVARNDEEQLMVECKFHRDKGHKNDVKIPLYIHSRFEDMKAVWQKEDNSVKYIGMIATNTRFSEDAVNYARCVGMRLVSWDYPAGNSLKDWIDRSGFHPITSLQSLTKTQKQFLLEEGIVLCRELLLSRALLQKNGLSHRKIDEILSEASAIVNE